MAPEQVRGQRLDKRSDVFSAGVILYELTTGRRLFSGSEVDVMTSIVERDVTPPSVWVPGFPVDLERILLTALSRDRTRRFPSAQHLARALEELAVSLNVVSTHQVLARFYQQVFSEFERRERTTGTYGPKDTRDRSGIEEAGSRLRSSHPPPLSASAPEGALRPRAAASQAQRAEPMRDLHSLRQELPVEELVSDAPGALHLPGGADFGEPQPVVLTRPKS